MQSNVKIEQFDALMRQNMSIFYRKVFGSLTPDNYLHAWYLDLLADKLEQVANGKIKRLIICVPPRSGKSLLTSVAFPAWVMGHNPTARIVTASYNQELASDLCNKQIDLMNRDFYKRAFNTRLSKRRCNAEYFATTKGGERIATSPGGTLTGRGGDIIILDDIIKPADAFSDTKRKNVNDWVEHTLYSRLNDKKTGSIIVVMQRVHEDDFVAHLLEKKGFEYIALPAIAIEDESFKLTDGRNVGRKIGEVLHPARDPIYILRELEKNMTPFHFSTQYQQLPIPAAGNLLKVDWFPRYDTLPTDTGYYIQSWDTASKDGNNNDWSVCTTWFIYGEYFYLANIFRKKLLFPELKKAIIEQKKLYSAKEVLIEDASSGTALIQDLRSSGVYVTSVKVQRNMNKEERVDAASISIYGGRVFIPNKAQWLDGFINEVRAFPNGRHDDQVDSMSQFINWKIHQTKNVMVVTKARAR